MSKRKMPLSGGEHKYPTNIDPVAAAQARSLERANPHPRAIAEGTLDVRGIAVRCFVLDTGQRVLSARGMLLALGSGAKDGHFWQFLTRISNDSNALKVGPKITFRARGGLHHGYPAEVA